MMAISLFLYTLEHLLEMNTMLEMTTLRAFLEAQPMNKGRVQISIRVHSGKPRTIRHPYQKPKRLRIWSTIF